VIVAAATVSSGCGGHGCEHMKPIRFAEHAWRVDEPDCGTRAAMAQDLVDRRVLVGSTRTRVKAILGSPDVIEGRTWTYELTPRIGSSLPDFLDVHFSVRNRVSSSRTALAGAP
jgi:hypothetical protein